MKLTIAVAAAIMASDQLVQAAPFRLCLFGPISCPPKAYRPGPVPVYNPADRQTYKQQLDEFRRAAGSSKDTQSADHASDHFEQYTDIRKKYLQDHGLIMKRSTEDGEATAILAEQR